MTDRAIADVSEILGEFDIDEVRKLIRSQIPLDNTSDSTRSITTDYFKPLYHHYKNAMQNGNEEVKDAAQDAFRTICMEFINQMSNKFGFCIDDTYLDTRADKLHTITMVLYSVFVLDFSKNLQEILATVINKDKAQLYEVFKDMKSKKDGSTITNKKNMNEEDAIIASNIFNITHYVLENMEEEYFLELLDEDECSKVVRAMYKDGIMTGGFMNAIRTIYSNDIPLRSSICFEIVCDIREKYKKKDEGESNE